MDRFNNFQSARPVGSSVWVLNQPYIILYKWKLVFIDLCPNYCCLYRLLGMELSARDNGFATTALQCRWRDSTSGAPDISQGGQLCMGDSHAWNTVTLRDMSRFWHSETTTTWNVPHANLQFPYNSGCQRSLIHAINDGIYMILDLALITKTLESI